MSWAPQGPYTVGGNFTNVNANNIETGIGQCTYTDGTNTATAPTQVARALSGTNKVFADFNATDGKRYQIFINTTGSFSIFNATDNVTVLSVGPAGGTITAGGNTVWTAANDGPGSGLDADTVDGVQAANILQFGTGGQKTGFKTTVGNALPVSGMTKGDCHILSPFALP